MQRNRPITATLVALVVAALCAIAIAFTAAAMIGSYSPTPFWDMWNGGLGFYVRVQDGDSAAWFAQHNEHRIVLSRILFWIDFELFGGRAVSLYVWNFVLALGNGALLALFVRKAIAGASWPLALGFSAFAAALALAWVQRDNLAWAFQSQFFLAQGLPLAASYLLMRSVDREADAGRSRAYFAGAVAFGAASAGAMANGVLALPLLVLQAALSGAPRLRVGVLVFFAAMINILYFRDYAPTSGHSSLATGLLNHPGDVAQFFLIYLGSPIAEISSLGRSALLSAISGGLLVAALTALTLAAWRGADQRTTRIALITFAAYECASAAAAAGGRYEFGPEYAMASRYATPALLVWGAAMALALVSFRMQALRRPAITLAALAIAAALLVRYQEAALTDGRQGKFERYAGAMALELGVRDSSRIDQIIPPHTEMYDIARVASARRLAVFSLPWIGGAGAAIGDVAQGRDAAGATCRGHIDRVSPLPNDPHWARIDGWLLSPSLNEAFNAVRIIDAQGRIAGFGAFGLTRPDVSAATGDPRRHSGFSGYVRLSAAGGPISVGARDGGCEIAATLAPFAYATQTAANIDTLAASGAIISAVAFDGALAAPKADKQVRTYASSAGGDAAKGEIRLKMERGQSIYYQSGPNAARQSLNVLPDGKFARSLPGVANWQGDPVEQWTVLRFESPALPERFELVIADEGDGWGEWSAIALRATEADE